MSITAIFLTAFMVALSGAMMPGSLLTATIAESTQRGFWAGPLIVLGHAILELVLILALLAGLSIIITQSGVTLIISVLGGAFLFYLGFTMVRDTLAGHVSIETTVSTKKTGKLMHPVPVGILMSLSNPFWIIWWATIGLSYLTLAMKNGPLGIGAFYSGHILADLLWYSLISALIAGGRRFINQKVYRCILLACGLFLIALGLYFIFSGIKL